MSGWRVVAARDALLATLVNPAFDPRRVVLLETDPTPLLSAKRAASATDVPPAAALRVEDRSTDAIEIWADVPASAVLLISDGYSAGWKVTARSEDSLPFLR